MDLIAELLLKPLSRRTFQEKLVIIKNGWATPRLARLLQAGKEFVRHFQTMNYEQYPWLSGSEEHGILFCLVFCDLCLAVTILVSSLPLLSGHFQPLSELKHVQEIRQGRLDFQH